MERSVSCAPTMVSACRRAGARGAARPSEMHSLWRRPDVVEDCKLRSRRWDAACADLGRASRDDDHRDGLAPPADAMARATMRASVCGGVPQRHRRAVTTPTTFFIGGRVGEVMVRGPTVMRGYGARRRTASTSQRVRTRHLASSTATDTDSKDRRRTYITRLQSSARVEGSDAAHHACGGRVSVVRIPTGAGSGGVRRAASPLTGRPLRAAHRRALDSVASRHRALQAPKERFTTSCRRTTWEVLKTLPRAPNS